MSKKFRVSYDVYNVADEMEEAVGNDGGFDADHYEYRVTIEDAKTGQIVSEFDSLSETYNGQPLSKETATKSAKEMVKDVESGNYDGFYMPKEYQTHPKTKKATKRSTATQRTIGGVR